MNNRELKHRAILQNIAHQAMVARGLLPNFSRAVFDQLDHINKPAQVSDHSIPDLRDLLWCSIDNDDSRDLDQLSVAEALDDQTVKILVAVADVDALVKIDTAIDGHAAHNTTSVYTASEIFPMLPEKLSTNLTSLNPREDRVAIVIEMRIGLDGSLKGSDIYRALVRNHAQLAYNSVAALLEGVGSQPEALSAVAGLADNLRLQDKVAQSMKEFRHIHGALSLDTIQAKPIFDDDQILRLDVEERNRAKEIIEDFMIAANGVVARYLDQKQYPSIRRVVRIPKRWDRIVEVAAEHKYSLPAQPDSKALEGFLKRQKQLDPIGFPDLSLTIIKLLGDGEYVADFPNSTVPGHFGLAVKDYTHSTAPNRRFSDLITHRILKAAFDHKPAPYRDDELQRLARHCTEAEDIVKKVERRVGKSAAALLLESRIGERFEAIVTGASAKGTWVRLLSMPVEGKLVEGFHRVDVGHRVNVELISVDVERGYIDFKRV